MSDAGETYHFSFNEDPFDGTDIDFISRIWPLLDNHAAQCCSTGLHLWHHILTQAERDEEEDLEDEITTERPDPLDGNATAAEIATYNQQCSEYRTFKAELLQCKKWFLSLIPMEVRTRINTTRNVNFATLSLGQVREHMIAMYGEGINSTSSRQLFNELHKPFTHGMDIAQHLKKLDRIFDYFDRIVEPMSQFIRYETLVRSMTTHPDYALFISQYEMSKPKTYSDLSTALMNHRTHLISVANAARHAPQVVAPHSAAEATMTSLPQGCQLLKPSKYCWTHGVGFHDSSESKKKGHGHKDKATAQQRMGGSNNTALPKITASN
jgi:hypothetical protein